MRKSLLLVLLSSAGSVAAQTEPAPQRVRLTAAAEVRRVDSYALPPKGTLVGLLVAEDDDSVTVRPEGHDEPIRISRASLRVFEVSRGRRSRMQGVLIGLGVGLGFGVVARVTCKDDFLDLCPAVGKVVAVGVGVPAALIGLAVSSGDRWERRPVRREGRGAHLRLEPRPRGLGAALTIGF